MTPLTKCRRNGRSKKTRSFPKITQISSYAEKKALRIDSFILKWISKTLKWSKWWKPTSNNIQKNALTKNSDQNRQGLNFDIKIAIANQTALSVEITRYFQTEIID